MHGIDLSPVREVHFVVIVSLLKGARGKPKADLRALVDAIMKVQRLAMDLSDDVAELDVNPLVAMPDGVVALDALVVCK